MYPMYDLHRHLSASFSTDLLYGLLIRSGLDISLEEVRKQSSFVDDDSGFDTFLNKFALHERVRWTIDAIYDVAHSAVANLVSEGIEYSEIRYSVDKYLKYIPVSAGEIMRHVREAFNQAQSFFQSTVEVKLLLGVKYETAWFMADQHLSDPERFAEYIDGLDFIGNELTFDFDTVHGISESFRACDLPVVAHAGEVGDTKLMKSIMEAARPSRVAHGICADSEVLDMCRDMDVVFDVALTSNVLTGQWPDPSTHPARQFAEDGFIITIGTDDPSTFNTTLAREYALVRKHWSLSDDDLEQLRLNSFKSRIEKRW